MLQNWALLAPDTTHVQFLLPIAGEDFIFYLQRDNKKQIVVIKDGKNVEYKHLYCDIKTCGYEHTTMLQMMKKISLSLKYHTHRYA